MNNRLLKWTMVPVLVLALSACSRDEAPPSGANGPQEPGLPELVESKAPTRDEKPAETMSASEAAPEPSPEAEAAGSDASAANAADEPQPPAQPTQYIVKGVVTQWSPMVLFVQPGDQIVFRQMAGHDSETIEGMIPEGASTWKSKLGQEGFAVAPEVPGVYIYKCNPHVSLGMIGAIVVGDTPPANLDAIEAHPDNKGMIGRAIRKLKQALEQHAKS